MHKVHILRKNIDDYISLRPSESGVICLYVNDTIVLKGCTHKLLDEGKIILDTRNFEQFMLAKFTFISEGNVGVMPNGDFDRLLYLQYKYKDGELTTLPEYIRSDGRAWKYFRFFVSDDHYNPIINDTFIGGYYAIADEMRDNDVVLTEHLNGLVETITTLKDESVTHDNRQMRVKLDKLIRSILDCKDIINEDF